MRHAGSFLTARAALGIVIAFGVLLLSGRAWAEKSGMVQSEPMRLSSADHAVMTIAKTDQTFGLITMVANRFWLTSDLSLRIYQGKTLQMELECMAERRDVSGEKKGLFTVMQLFCLLDDDQARSLAQMPSARLELEGRASLVDDSRKVLFEAKIRKSKMKQVAQFVASHLD